MRVGTAAQDRGVACLETQRARVGGNVGAAFINHADDAERRAHALDRHAVRALPAFQHHADRIGDAADHVEAVGHRENAVVVEFKPVEERAADAGLFGLGDILAIGGQNFGLGDANRVRLRLQRGVLLRLGGLCQLACGRARGMADLAHQGVEIVGRRDGFQRRGHELKVNRVS